MPDRHHGLNSSRVVNIEDLRRLGQRRLPRAVFDDLDGGAEAELTLSSFPGCDIPSPKRSCDCELHDHARAGSRTFVPRAACASGPQSLRRLLILRKDAFSSPVL